jgi:hypothetical protein
MKWAYLLVFNSRMGTRGDVTSFLDADPNVTYWYACLPSSVFLISTDTAGVISERLREHFGDKRGYRFFITEVSSDRNGWVPKQVWHMLKNVDDPRLPE